jgi:glyoxylase I family protein
MPEFSGVSHISFSVRDCKATAEWWREVFALEDAGTLDDQEGWRGVLLFLTPSIAIEFQQHDANEGETFDPVRTGFDHMGLKVDTRDELDAWQQHFEHLGVEHTPVVERDYGDGPMAVLTFKDPDCIQFEMFHWADHP